MISIPKDNWRVIEEGNPRGMPIIDCPNCKNWLLGAEAIQGVRENGEVHASVICTHVIVKQDGETLKVLSREFCTFHDHVILEDWDKGVVAHK